MDSEIFYEGWMVKSPPQKRSSHGYPLIKKKWRRRWFVLEPGKFPGQYLLCYYADEQKKRLKGTICLDECDQVDIGLKDENGKYDFMFNIRTPKRIYFLAVDSPEEMKTWARLVCEACGLRSTPEEENAQSFDPPSSSGQPTTRPRSATASATTSSAASNIHQPQISSPYIHISECYTGTRPPPKQQQQPPKSNFFHIRSISTGNGDVRAGGTTSPQASFLTDDDDDDDDNVFEDSSPPSHAAPRPPTWTATSGGHFSVSEDSMISSLKIRSNQPPPNRPPKPAHLVNPISGASPAVATGFENYANSSDMQEVYRTESNNNSSMASKGIPTVSRDLKPGRKVQGSVTMAGRSHHQASSLHHGANFATMGPPVERGQKPRTKGMSTTMPRFTSSSRQAPNPIVISHDANDDWLNTDDVFRGNASDDEQIYFYMPPMNTLSTFGGSSLPLMIPADSFEHPSVAYIELDLPKVDETGTSAAALTVQPSKAAEEESKTIYKVIDKEKTYAFKKTKEDRENQRHQNDS